ncbi:hypothetical protein ACQP2T_40265 [Nonomuraea sp. CA-143628]|uniref:hypothetical protein n=1 Tax=Nonomuraea sp. CA-143628 TaxID=3239997 RepID=UPI003D8BFEA5
MRILRTGYKLAPAMAAAFLVLTLTSCGSGSGSGETAATGTTAAEAADTNQKATEKTAAPAGESVKTGVMDQLRKTREIKELPYKPAAVTKFVSCMANVLVKYSNKKDLQAFAHGSLDLESIRQTDKAAADKAGFKCTEVVSKDDLKQ